MSSKKREKVKSSTDGLAILYHRFIKNDPEMQKMIEEAEFEAVVARKVYHLRKAAGLAQTELAQLIGTQPSAISRLENADYRGHSLSMLRKIAYALNMRLELDFVPIKQKKAA